MEKKPSFIDILQNSENPGYLNISILDQRTLESGKIYAFLEAFNSEHQQTSTFTLPEPKIKKGTSFIEEKIKNLIVNYPRFNKKEAANYASNYLKLFAFNHIILKENFDYSNTLAAFLGGIERSKKIYTENIERIGIKKYEHVKPLILTLTSLLRYDNDFDFTYHLRTFD